MFTPTIALPVSYAKIPARPAFEVKLPTLMTPVPKVVVPYDQFTEDEIVTAAAAKPAPSG
jgi:hypothetical protein